MGGRIPPVNDLRQARWLVQSYLEKGAGWRVCSGETYLEVLASSLCGLGTATDVEVRDDKRRLSRKPLPDLC